ncbi:MAG: 2-dehydropantoate 2-reductase [Ignavibacteriota bacterium]
MPPSVAVVGAGAVGCYFGGMLARAGVPVTLIGRAAHMDAISLDGLFLDGISIQERIPVAATTSLEDGVRVADIVLFCVKTVSTESTAWEIAPYLAPHAAILSLQKWRRQCRPHPARDWAACDSGGRCMWRLR